jgi:uncharacterized surface protein with fasciclin (FAS1) repeats
MSHKRLAVVITSAVAALALSACSSASATTTAQPTPGATDSTQQPTPTPSESGAAGEEFGPACAAIPTDPNNPGSFEAMATEQVMTAVAANPDYFSTFVAAVEQAGLTETLNNNENMTVFVPTDDAFAKVPAADLDAIMASPEMLTEILLYHVVQETLTPDKLAGTHETLQGDSLTVAGSGTDFKVNEVATVVCGNVKTANATVYAVDSVILPS